MNTWLWSDRNIGKRESRELREEHNIAVNQNVRLLEALQAVADAGRPDEYGFSKEMQYAQHAAYLTIQALRKVKETKS